VAIDQSGDHAPALQVDPPAVRTGKRHDLAFIAHRLEAAVADRGSSVVILPLKRT
jgi:hypothetical protein